MMPLSSPLLKDTSHDTFRRPAFRLGRGPGPRFGRGGDSAKYDSVGSYGANGRLLVRSVIPLDPLFLTDRPWMKANHDRRAA